MMFAIHFQEDAERNLLMLDASTRERILKRIDRMRNEPPGRHMKHGLPYFVEEAGQYRIVYELEGNLKNIYFVGDHKSYERWYKKL